VSFPEALNRFQTGYEIGRHRLLVNLIQNLLSQRLVFAFRQLPSIKRGRALVSPGQKSGVGQDLEVVAQCALAHRKCGAKLRHTERIGPHNPEHLYSQWVCHRTEKRIQRLGDFVADSVSRALGVQRNELGFLGHDAKASTSRFIHQKLLMKYQAARGARVWGAAHVAK
jgi:hypothetical protein